ncbi:MAG: SMC-Scp complex subunit ScpB [Clostridia bacterium]|nr:SMC-Scp complex subunit ScpB [Clostridia bacterium]
MEQENTERKVYPESEAIRAMEAMLFAAGHMLRYEQMGEVLSLEEETVRSYAEKLAEKYKGAGIQLILFTEGCQLTTREEFLGEIRTVLGIRRGGNLSRSSLETLAIVAYQQPVTRSYIDEVRGVDSGYVVSALVEKGLLEPKGRLDAPGHPTLYGTTNSFLRVFGLDSLDSLPPPSRFLPSDLPDDESAELASEALSQIAAKD